MKTVTKPKTEKEDALSFLFFLLTEGYDPYKYENTLELIQSASNSMSKYLKNCKQFLLSHQVSYQDLESYQIKGANGYLSDIYNKGIVIPDQK